MHARVYGVETRRGQTRDNIVFSDEWLFLWTFRVRWECELWRRKSKSLRGRVCTCAVWFEKIILRYDVARMCWITRVLFFRHFYVWFLFVSYFVDEDILSLWLMINFADNKSVTMGSNS